MEKTDPYEVELLDLWNEVGGKMIIKYHRATITPAKEDLVQMREKGFQTNVMMCILSSLVGHGYSQEEVLAFMAEAEAAGASPKVTFEATEKGGLNVKSKEENPVMNSLVEAISQQ